MLIILASRIIKMAEPSILPAQQKSCLRLHGMIGLQTPGLLHRVIHPDGSFSPGQSAKASSIAV
jgi:hypothetical protein